VWRALEAIVNFLQLCDCLIHVWSVRRIVNPHTLHQVDQFRTPLPLETFCRRSLALCADDIINGMLVHTLPGILGIWQMPLEHLPIYHRAREDVNLEVVFWLRMPQLWCLPVDRPDQTSDH